MSTDTVQVAPQTVQQGPPQQVPPQQVFVQLSPQNAVTPDGDQKKSSVAIYIFWAAIIAIIIFVLYYGYNHFTADSTKEQFTQEQERDDPATDFNLRAAIKKLNDMQKKVLAGLSETF